jgi:hypothetical protein
MCCTEDECYPCVVMNMMLPVRFVPGVSTGSGSSHLAGATQSAGVDSDPVDRDDDVAIYRRSHKAGWAALMSGAAAGM